jgi:hypothetical protein
VADFTYHAEQHAFTAAADWFADVTVTADGRWDAPALGVWTVRDLVGHTSRALSTIETYLAAGAAEATVGTAVEYFRIVLGAAGDPDAIAQRGRDAGAALGPDPGSAVVDLAERVVGLVRRSEADALVATPAGGMSLASYLPTRTFELVVHTTDLAVALGQDPEPPTEAAARVWALVGELAADRREIAPLLLAATGRGLSNSYSVLDSRD